MINAAAELTDATRAREAKAYFTTLSDDERDAWVQRARLFYADIDMGLSDDFFVAEAAHLAREAEPQGWRRDRHPDPASDRPRISKRKRFRSSA